MPIKTFYRRKLIVHDENDNFVELSGWKWNIITDDGGEIIHQFEGAAEVITTDHAELTKILGEEVIAATEAASVAAKNLAVLSDQHDDLQKQLSEAKAANEILTTQLADVQTRSDAIEKPQAEPV